MPYDFLAKLNMTFCHTKKFSLFVIDIDFFMLQKMCAFFPKVVKNYVLFEISMFHLVYPIVSKTGELENIEYRIIKKSKNII